MNKNDLNHRLAKEGFRSDLYSINGGFPSLLEGYVLRRIGSRWTIEYYERGIFRTLAEYANEDEACEGMYEILKADPTTRKLG